MFIFGSDASAADGDSSAKDPAREVIGTWKQSDKDKVNLIRFEGVRMVQFREGELRFQRVRYKEGRIVTVSFDGEEQPFVQFEIKDGTLLITDSARKNVPFRRIDKDPPELMLEALKLGERKALARDKVHEIEKELARREVANIRVRTDYRELIKDPKNLDQKKVDAKLQEMLKIDADDSKYLRDLLADVGWIDGGRFSDAAVNGAYLIVMHTKDFALMQGALPELEKEVKAKRFEAELYAGLFDRFRTITAQPERYGMHVTPTAKGELVVGPLENRTKVDEFRKAIGLPPLTEYLERYKEENGGKPVRVRDD
jgi:hypothetical protein